MPHFAKVRDNKVINVIVADQEFIDNFVDNEPGEWIQCSYNTRNGKHYNPDTNEEDGIPPLRYNYPSIGFSYDPNRDAFIPPRPYKSWKLNEDTCQWEPPVEYPEDTNLNVWNEDNLCWEPLIEDDSWMDPYA